MAKDFSDWRSAKGRNSLISIALDMADYMEERYLVKNLNKTARQAGSPGKNTGTFCGVLTVRLRTGIVV